MKKQFQAFAALIYVTDVEELCVKQMFKWEERQFDDDGQLYYETIVQREGRNLLIAASKQPEMGMTAAATLSMKLIAHYQPQYLIMPGIAAGIDKSEKKDFVYGDVVLASSVWNYANGKYVSPEKAEIIFGSVGFIPRPLVLYTETKLMDILQKAAVSKEHESYVQVGAMATGSTVVANNRAISHVYTQSFDTKGLDMEAYGVAYAAQESLRPQPYAIIAKSICDFADGNKDDRFQLFAAFTSCQFVEYLITKALPERGL